MPPLRNTLVLNAELLQNCVHPREREFRHGFPPELVSNLLSLGRIDKRSHTAEYRQPTNRQKGQLNHR
jgi:hypothetical protein